MVYNKKPVHNCAQVTNTKTKLDLIRRNGYFLKLPFVNANIREKSLPAKK